MASTPKAPRNLTVLSLRRRGFETSRSPAPGAVSLAGATPTVVDLSGGAITDNAPFILTGSGFGTRTGVNTEFLAGLNGVVPSMTTSARFSSLARPGWSWLGSLTTPTCSTERYWARGKSLICDMRSSAEYQKTLFYDTGGGSRIFFSGLMYLDHDSLTSGWYLQWKVLRFTQTESVVDATGNPHAYLSNRPGSGSFFSWFNSTGQHTVFFGDAPYSTELPGKGSWQRYRVWVKKNSAPGVADGYFRVETRNALTNAVTCNVEKTNCDFLGAGDSSGNTFRYVCLQNFFGNASDGGHNPDNANATAWWAETYIAAGNTDDVFKFAEISDGVKVGEIQLISSWSNTAVSFPINQGAHANLSGKTVNVYGGLPYALLGSGALA